MRYALSGKIKCMHDGATFIKGSYKNKRTGEVNKYWGCSNYRKYGRTKSNGCKTPILRYEELLIIFKKILKGIIGNKNSIISEIYSLINESKIKKDYTKEIKEIDMKISTISKQSKNTQELKLNQSQLENVMKQLLKFDTINEENKSLLLKLIDKIIIDDDKINIKYKFNNLEL